MRPTPATVAAALLVLLSGCATTDPTVAPAAPATTSAAATTAQGVRVVLAKSGGIAGIQDTVTVAPDGRWTVVDRSGATRTGRLSPTDLDRLRQLATDPRLAAENAATTAPTNCADTFTYRLTVHGRTTGYVDCPTDPDRPAATAAVVELLTRATA